MSLPRIIARRGYSACYPDDTWSAIRAAQTAGAECCEIDLMLSADGEVIINHDYFIGERRIAEMQSSEARQQLADSPRFEELLDSFHAPFLKEFKDVGPELVTSLLDLGVDGICTSNPERLKNLRDHP